MMISLTLAKSTNYNTKDMPISEVYNCDCLEYMRSLPDKYFDLCIADPPYSIGISSNPVRQAHTKKDWDNELPNKEIFLMLYLNVYLICMMREFYLILSGMSLDILIILDLKFRMNLWLDTVWIMHRNTEIFRISEYSSAKFTKNNLRS